VIERTCALSEGNLLKLADLPAPVRNRLSASAQAAEHEADDIVATNAPETVREAAPASSKTPPGSGTAALGVPSPLLKPLKDFLREQEVAYLNRVLTHTNGDKEQAAELLGISLATLYRKLAEAVSE
jgi:DNA-binding NtrC family response regulator